MGRRGMTAEEADDFSSEHGTGVTPMDVYNRELEDREERARAAEPRCRCGNPSCPQRDRP
jgi:hypothetical protein